MPPGWLLIGRSKNGRPRALPMSGEAQEMLRLLFEDQTRGEYVFQNGRTGVNIVDHLTFHDRRWRR